MLQIVQMVPTESSVKIHVSVPMVNHVIKPQVGVRLALVNRAITVLCATEVGFTVFFIIYKCLKYWIRYLLIKDVPVTLNW